MDLPGWRLHPLKGQDKGRHAIWVSGKVLGRSAESWMAMQANHTLARYQAELEQWTPTRQVTAEGLVAVKDTKSKAKPKAAAKTAAA